MASYTYDENGQSVFFVLTFLLFTILPWTYYSLKPQPGPQLAKAPHPAWDRKDPAVLKAKRRGSPIKLNHLLLAIAWGALAYVVFQATKAKNAGTTYDPFAILGISSNLAEKEIKRHYRKLSLKFHPDKLTLTGNQTKEEADSHFVELTKAYKALTDEVVRKNYELYGHPDGKQEFGMGIALPAWVVETHNNGYILGLYGLVFGIGLPFLVGRWWWGARSYTKDRVLNETATTYFQGLPEESTFAQALEALAASSEFKHAQAGSRSTIRESKAFEKLEKDVKEHLRVRNIRLEGKLLRRPYAKKTAVLLYSHLFRLPISDAKLSTERLATVMKAIEIVPALANIALAYKWLNTYLLTTSLRGRLIQALHPSLPSILQFPHLTPSMAQQLVVKHSLSSVEDYLNCPVEERRSALKQVQDTETTQSLSEAQIRDIENVASDWPRLEILGLKLSVLGETSITPASFVQFTIKVQQVSADGENVGKANGIQSKMIEQAADDESEPTKRPKSTSKELPYSVHAPHVSGRHHPIWKILIVDHKMDRIFSGPCTFDDIGSNKARSLTMEAQAPGNPGYFTFQLYLTCDSYIGTYAQTEVKLAVTMPTEVKMEDDDISEPDEDTLAGQLAAMRRQPVKRIADNSEDEDEGDDDDDDDDTSGTEEEIVYESSDSDSD